MTLISQWQELWWCATLEGSSYVHVRMGILGDGFGRPKFLEWSELGKIVQWYNGR